MADLDGQAARAGLRAALPPKVDPQDLLMPENLLGIADPRAALPQVDPDCQAAPVDRTDQHRTLGAHRTGAVHHRGRALGFVISWTYGLEVSYGVVRADDSAVRAIEEAVQIAEGITNDSALGLVEYALGSRCCIATTWPTVTAGWS